MKFKIVTETDLLEGIKFIPMFAEGLLDRIMGYNYFYYLNTNDYSINLKNISTSFWSSSGIRIKCDTYNEAKRVIEYFKGEV